MVTIFRSLNAKMNGRTCPKMSTVQYTELQSSDVAAIRNMAPLD